MVAPGRDRDRIEGVCGEHRFTLRWESGLAPAAAAAVAALLPLDGLVRHGKWSGEAFWLPLDEPIVGLPVENATSYPAPGDVVLYPGDGAGVPELLFAYGAVHFRGKTGSMHATHVLTVDGGLDVLREIGRRTDWHGAQALHLDRATS